jgi:hypothetical protein
MTSTAIGIPANGGASFSMKTGRSGQVEEMKKMFSQDEILHMRWHDDLNPTRPAA